MPCLLVLIFCWGRLWWSLIKARKIFSSKDFNTLEPHEKLKKLAPAYSWKPLGASLRAHLDSLIELKVMAPKRKTVKSLNDTDSSSGFDLSKPLYLQRPGVPHLSMQDVPKDSPEIEEVVELVPSIAYRAPVSARFTISRSNNISHWLCSDALRHVPGILTGVGIVGTFYGIYQGLSKMRESLGKLGSTVADKQVDLITEAVDQLFGHVSPAFHASMICVGLAVIFTIIEKVAHKLLFEDASALAGAIDETFPVLQSEKIMQDLSNASARTATDFRTILGEVVSVQLKSSLDELRSIQTEQAQTIKDALKGSIDESLNRLIDSQKEQNNLLTTSLASSISGALQPMSSTLENAVRQIKSESSTATADMIRDMAGEFKNALATSAGGQLNELAETIKGSADLMGSQKAAMTDFVKTMYDQMEQQGQLVKDALLRSSEQQAAQTAAFQSQLSEILTEVKLALNSMAEESTQKSKQGLEAIGASVNELLAQSLELQKTSSETIQESISETRGVLSEQITQFQEATTQQITQMSAAVNDVSQKMTSDASKLLQNLQSNASLAMAQTASQMDRASQNAVEKLSSQVQASLSSIEAKTSELVEATATSQRTLALELGELSKKIATASNNSTESSLAIARQTQQTVTDLNTMSKNLQELLPKLETAGGGFSEAGQRLLDVTEQLKEHSEKASEMTKASAALVTEVKQVHNLFAQQTSTQSVQLKALADATDGMKSTTESLKTVNEQVAQSIKTFQTETAKVFHSMTVKQEEHGRGIADALKGYLSSFDKSMANSCNGLQAIVEELSGALQDFKDDQPASPRR